jgi:hypothetical protein
MALGRAAISSDGVRALRATTTNRGDAIVGPATENTFEVGDRVALRGAEEAGGGTVIDILEFGMIRVLWERPELMRFIAVSS